MTTKHTWQRIVGAFRPATLPKSWQRGAADLVSVAVGMVILSICVAGTAGSMIYGRETLIRQEHYKTAAFYLRGTLEEECAAIQLIDKARNPSRTPGVFDALRDYQSFPLDLSTDRGGNIEPVILKVSRDQIRPVDLPETGMGIDYYIVTVRGKWAERDMAENGTQRGHQNREIVLTTAVIVREEL